MERDCHTWEGFSLFSAGEVVGSTPHILYDPETSANVLDDFRASLKEDGTVQSETVIYRRDGTRLNMALSISPLCLCGDGVDHYLALQWDVTAHRETCARNRDLEALTRLQRAVIMENLNIDSLRQRVANWAGA